DELLEGRFISEKQDCRVRRLSDVIRQEAVDWIDLLKIDVQRAELDVLRGIATEDWNKISQIVMEVHDGQGTKTEGRLQSIVTLLEERGFQIRTEQYQELRGTDRWALYGRKPESMPPASRSANTQANGTKNSGRSVSVKTLRQYLGRALPDYMVPT